MAAPKITTGYTQPGTKLIVKPIIAKYKDTKKYQADLANFYAKSTDPEAVKYRTDELTKKYGSLKNADGKPLFTPTYIKALAEGVEPPASLDKAVTDWATAKMKEATNYDWNNFSGGIGSVAAQNLLSSFVKDPSQVDTALTFKTSDVEFTDDEKKANAIKLQDKTAKDEKDAAALENYDPNAGTWDPSKNTQATPFGDVLSGLISGYKNPYAADYVNPLAAVETPNLTNIQTPFNKNAIPQDLVNLFNSAGTDYAGGNNPLTKGTSLGSGLLKLYQPSTTDSSGQLAKPGAPDTTSTTLPKITGDGTTVVNSDGSTTIGGGTTGGTTGGYTTLADWHKAVSAAENLMTGSPTQANKDAYNAILAARPNIVSDPQGIANLDPYAISNMDPNAFKDPNRYKGTFLQADIDALNKTPKTEIAADKIAADKIDAEKNAWIKTTQDAAKPPMEYANALANNTQYSDLAAIGKSQIDQLNAQKIAADKAAADKIAADKIAADKIAAEKAAADKIEADRQAGIKAAIASQANLEASAQNAGYQGALSDTGAMQGYLNSQNVGVQDYTGNYAKQPYVNYTSAPSSQQQLEDQAVNAGYQGDYSDTAAMQGHLSSLPPAVDTVKPVNTGIVTPDVTKFATIDNLNTASGVGVNTLLGGNTQPAAGTGTVQPPAVVQQPAATTSKPTYQEELSRLTALQDSFNSKAAMDAHYAAHPEDNVQNLRFY